VPGCGVLNVLNAVPRRTGGIPPHADQRTCDKLLRALRRLGERGFALLVERRKALRRVTVSLSRVTGIARAAFSLMFARTISGNPQFVPIGDEV
jgi:hypothetical protein